MLNVPLKKALPPFRVCRVTLPEFGKPPVCVPVAGLPEYETAPEATAQIASMIKSKGWWFGPWVVKGSNDVLA